MLTEIIILGLAVLVILHVILSGSIRGGWEGALIYQGSWTDIILDDSASAGQTLFYFPAWPVTDSGYVVTDDETDVTLYKDGVAVNSGDWALDGSEGTCTLNSGCTGGETISATFYFKETVGYWQDIEFEANNNIEKVKVGGQREVYDLKEHNIEYTLKVGSVYIDLRALWRAAGRRYSVTSLPSLTAHIQTATSGGDDLELTDVKFDKSKLTMASGKVHGFDVQGYAISLSHSST